MSCKLSKTKRYIRGEVRPPGSKSISNRVLLIEALLGQAVKIDNLSEANDTQTMKRLLRYRREAVLDAGDAGTTYRFLTAFLALQPGKQVLTGSRRMRERPIGILVEALKTLGANINYLGHHGFPPLLIAPPRTLDADRLCVPGHISSQFISALLLIAPKLPNGLSLEIEGNLVSKPYVQMTLEIMAEFGILYSWRSQDKGEQSIFIPPQNYEARPDFEVETDWSAASYYYAMAALAEEADILVRGLRPQSLQGDSRIAELMRGFGVETQFERWGARLRKLPGFQIKRQRINCIDCPDLAQTLAVTAAALDCPLELEGLQTLKIKETDRILALKTELEKLGCLVEADERSLRLLKGIRPQSPCPLIQTYEDHRMAMAFAPLALCLPQGLSFEQADVVRKSYPGFWKDLKALDFEVELKPT